MVGFWLMMVAALSGSFGRQAAPAQKPASVPTRDWIPLKLVAWTPPKTTIDPEYLRVAEQLLGNGLGDPRGRKFEQVRVEIDMGPWMPRTIVNAYGWVSKDGSHAILFDGLDYPVTRVIGPANLESALREESRRPLFSRFSPSPGLAQWVVPPDLATPALLLLVNRVSLAEAEYKSVSGTGVQVVQNLLTRMVDGYLAQAGQALTSRDDRDGLEWARSLVLVQELNDKGPASASPLQSRLEARRATEFAIMYRDFQRRVRHPKPEPFKVSMLTGLSKRRRIALLMSYLDTVRGQQIANPGGLAYFFDPVIQAIVKQGNAAVPSLIREIANDNRLTRSVPISGSFPSPDIGTVREAAWAALEKIWTSSMVFGGETPQTTSKTLTEAWKRFAGLTEPERWLDVLADDSMPPKSWLLAAKYFTDPVGETPGQQMHFGRIPAAPHSKNGDALGIRQRKIVTRLISRRALEMAAFKVTDSSEDLFLCDDALEMGHCLAKWDLKASAEVNRQVCAKTLAVDNLYDANVLNPVFYEGPIFGAVISDRAMAGGSGVASDYAAFAHLASEMRNPGFMSINLFRVLWTCPKDKATNLVGYDLLKRYFFPGSPAGQAASTYAEEDLDRSMYSKLLTLAPFRRLAARFLNDTRPVGEAWLESDGQGDFVRFMGNGSGTGGMSLPKDARPYPKPGVRFRISEADIFAQGIAVSETSAPTYSMVWPEKMRAVARKRIQEWLNDGKLDWNKIATAFPYQRQRFGQ